MSKVADERPAPAEAHVMTGRIVKDPKEVRRHADAIVGKHGLNPDETAILAADFLHRIADGFIGAAYGGFVNGQEGYERDYRMVVKAVQATGLPPHAATGLVLAWALQVIQGLEMRLDSPGELREGAGKP